MSTFRIVVLASGSGTNLQAILNKLHGGDEGIEVAGVGSDKAGAGALDRARRAEVETAVFPASDYADREARDRALGDWIEGRGADLVVLAGYMQMLSPDFVGRFRNRVINVHPALLPAFPGIDSVQQAIDHGSKITGVTVHFVEEGMDSGPIIMQRPVPVAPSRDWDETEKAIHATEHELLPETIRLIAAGRIRIDETNPRLVHIEPES
ncbi:MAG TPA: phosphoribosylglycinamide formyltransferase [Solirubrobacterales bacterium]|nr:phosphoribosylglycinamide formyltransferase [Solirubrobacterales bacterium]